MAYKNAAKKQQASIRRIIPKQLGDFEEISLTDDEYYSLLRKRYAQLSHQCSLMKKGSQERYELNLYKKTIEIKLREFNGSKPPISSTLPHCFLDVARKTLPRETFQELFKLANELLKKNKEADNESGTTTTEPSQPGHANDREQGQEHEPSGADKNDSNDPRSIPEST